MMNSDIFNPLCNNNDDVHTFRFKYNTRDLPKYGGNNFTQTYCSITMTRCGSPSKILKQQILIILFFIVYQYSTIWTAILYIPLVIMYYLSTKESHNAGEVGPAFVIDNSKYYTLFWVILLGEICLI